MSERSDLLRLRRLKELEARAAGVDRLPAESGVRRVELPSERNPIGMGEGIARAALQGVTFGGGDELAAGLKAAVNPSNFSEVYDETLERARSRADQFREESPVTATVAEIGGALPTAFIPMGALGRAAQVGSLPARTAASGALAATQGGIYGFNAGEGGVGPRLESGAKTALISGPLGMAGPALGVGVNKVGNKIAQSRAANRAASQAGVSRPAQNILNRAMDADGSFSGQGAANIARAGDDAMLADAGSNARTLLDTAIQRSGRAGNIARDAIDDRAVSAGQRMTASLDDAFGAGGLPATPRPQLNPLYERAYGSPIDYASEVGRRLENAVVSRVPPKAIKAANDLMRLEGQSSRQILADIAEDGAVTFRQMPDVRQLDYITRGLNEVAEQADGAGKLGGTTQLGRASANLSRQIRRDMREAVPAYGEALDAAAGLIREGKAREFGETLLSARISRTDASEILDGMSKSERASAGLGVRQAIDDTLANTRRAMLDTNMDIREAVALARNLSSRANRDKVSSLLGDEAASKLFDDLDRATAALDLRASVAGNSRTFARSSMDDIVRGEVEGGAIGQVLEGKPVSAGRRLLQGFTGRSPERQAAKGDEIYSEIARILTERRGPEALSSLNAINSNIPPRTFKASKLAELLAQRNAPVTSRLLD